MIPERKKKEIEDLAVLLIEAGTRLLTLRSAYRADDYPALIGRHIASVKHSLSLYQARQQPVILDIEEQLADSAEDDEL